MEFVYKIKHIKTGKYWNGKGGNPSLYFKLCKKNGIASDKKTIKEKGKDKNILRKMIFTTNGKLYEIGNLSRSLKLQQRYNKTEWDILCKECVMETFSTSYYDKNNIMAFLNYYKSQNKRRK